MNINIFKKLGLNEKEIKIYLCLLEHGAASVRSLSELTGINRGTVYDILKKFQSNELVSYYHHEKKQKFVAEEPERLEKLVNKKEEELKRVKNSFLDLIPELKSLQLKANSNKPVSKFYEEKKGVKTILNDVLLTMNEADEKEYYIYSAKKASEDMKVAYSDFTRDRIKRKIKVKAISLAKGGKTYGLDERKWLGTNDESATFIIIYSGKCAFISRDNNNSPIGVVIENEMIYETQKSIFLRLWDLIK